MFMPTAEDAQIAESAMVAFCATLNTPVVNVEGLPVGPARAGILLSASEYGDLNLWVRVASLSSDQGLTFKFQGDPSDLGAPAQAIEAALSFAEGMGFLFEEDMIAAAGGGDARRAYKVWMSLLEGDTEAHEVDDVEPEDLVDVEDIDDPTADLESVEPPPVARREPAPKPAARDRAQAKPARKATERPRKSHAPPRQQATGAQVMTKFRKSVPAADAPPVERKPGAEALARIELQSEEVASEYVDHTSFLSRVLGSF